MLTWIRALASRIRVWLSPGHADSEFAQELEEHLAMLTEENVRRGMGPEEAARAGRMRLGGVTQLSETNRELKGLPILETFMARHYFPNQDPLGKRLTFGFPPDGAVEREIVGIVGDVRDVALGQEPGPMMYVPYGQAPFWGANMVVKSTLSVSSVVAAIREEVRRIDKDLPVTDIATMPEIVNASVAQTRFRTFLLALFAGMALLLAATGIFGVISYSVSCRTNEIGIRVALGASSGSILGGVFRETLMLALVGLAIGLPCALAASRLIGHLLFGVSPYDPATLGAVALGLAAVAAMAGYVPARRAMRVDPMVALRHE